MRVLFLGCHCDDIELGCGGTISKYRNEWEMIAVTLSSDGLAHSMPELKECSQKALQNLGLTESLYYNFPVSTFWEVRQDIWLTLNELEKRYKPDLIFTQQEDSHQDHTTLYQESMRNFTNCDMMLYCSNFTNDLNKYWNWFEVLDEIDVQAKVDIVKEYPCYGDKVYCNAKNIEAQLRVCGMYANSEFAEGFTLNKKIVK